MKYTTSSTVKLSLSQTHFIFCAISSLVTGHFDDTFSSTLSAALSFLFIPTPFSDVSCAQDNSTEELGVPSTLELPDNSFSWHNLLPTLWLVQKCLEGFSQPIKIQKGHKNFKDLFMIFLRLVSGCPVATLICNKLIL